LLDNSLSEQGYSVYISGVLCGTGTGSSGSWLEFTCQGNGLYAKNTGKAIYIQRGANANEISICGMKILAKEVYGGTDI
jgi:hypothetical protein